MATGEACSAGAVAAVVTTGGSAMTADPAAQAAPYAVQLCADQHHQRTSAWQHKVHTKTYMPPVE